MLRRRNAARRSTPRRWNRYGVDLRCRGEEKRGGRCQAEVSGRTGVLEILTALYELRSQRGASEQRRRWRPTAEFYAARFYKYRWRARDRIGDSVQPISLCQLTSRPVPWDEALPATLERMVDSCTGSLGRPWREQTT